MSLCAEACLKAGELSADSYDPRRVQLGHKEVANSAADVPICHILQVL